MSAATARLGAGRRARARIATGVMVALLLVAGVLTLCLGDFGLTPGDVVQVLLGGGERLDRFIVTEVRLPRLVLAVLVGAAFGLSGGLFQSVLRNPLASPDVIGVTSGASVAALAALLGGASPWIVSASAFGGALLVSGVIAALSMRGGHGISGYRFVLIGIAVALMGRAVLEWVLTRSDVRDASTALSWLVGSVGNSRWPEILVLAIAMAVLLPLVGASARPLGLLESGDELATGLGAPARRLRPLLLALAVALAAAGTAAAGPMAFVALIAAPVARRVLRLGRPSLGATALVGALIVAWADIVAQHALPETIAVPAGIVTGAIGAAYLLWLLATGRDRERSR